MEAPTPWQYNNVFPLISGGKVELNRGSGLRRFNATFPPNIKGKTKGSPSPAEIGMAAATEFLFSVLMSLTATMGRSVLKDRDKWAIAARGQVNGHADNATDRL